MSEATERLTASIVLVGKFNPAIFSPAWIANAGLVDEQATQLANLQVIHPEIAVFEVGGFSIDVRPTRFAIEVASEPLVRVLDVTLALFDELLPHTPITELGINYSEHIDLKSAERRVSLGRALAPLGPWGAWGAEIGSLTGNLTSGMIELTMIRSYDPSGSGERRADVQPSTLVPENRGVFVAVNDHRRLLDNEAEGAKSAMELIRADFDESLIASRNIVGDLTNFAMGLPG